MKLLQYITIILFALASVLIGLSSCKQPLTKQQQFDLETKRIVDSFKAHGWPESVNPNIDTIGQRYFFVTYSNTDIDGEVFVTTKNGDMLNRKSTIEGARKQLDIKGSIIITSIYEFKSKREYDNFTK